VQRVDFKMKILVHVVWKVVIMLNVDSLDATLPEHAIQGFKQTMMSATN